MMIGALKVQNKLAEKLLNQKKAIPGFYLGFLRSLFWVLRLRPLLTFSPWVVRYPFQGLAEAIIRLEIITLGNLPLHICGKLQICWRIQPDEPIFRIATTVDAPGLTEKVSIRSNATKLSEASYATIVATFGMYYRTLYWRGKEAANTNNRQVIDNNIHSRSSMEAWKDRFRHAKQRDWNDVVSQLKILRAAIQKTLFQLITSRTSCINRRPILRGPCEEQKARSKIQPESHS